MRNLIRAAVLSLTLVTLVGCAEWNRLETQTTNAIGILADTKVNSKAAYIAINVFNAAERSVTAYLNLPLCNGRNTLCRALGAAEALDQPFNAGIVARNNVRSFMKANPGTFADAGLYNTLQAATTSLQNVMAVYGIGTGASK